MASYHAIGKHHSVIVTASQFDPAHHPLPKGAKIWGLDDNPKDGSWGSILTDEGLKHLYKSDYIVIQEGKTLTRSPEDFVRSFEQTHD